MPQDRVLDALLRVRAVFDFQLDMTSVRALLSGNPAPHPLRASVAAGPANADSGSKPYDRLADMLSSGQSQVAGPGRETERWIGPNDAPAFALFLPDITPLNSKVSEPSDGIVRVGAKVKTVVASMLGEVTVAVPIATLLSSAVKVSELKSLGRLTDTLTDDTT